MLALRIIGVPIPDEGLLAFASYLVYKGQLQLFPTMGAPFLGSVCGIHLSYGLGRTIGNYLITKFGHAVQITGDKISHIHTWFDRVEKWGLLFGSFLPGVRHLIGFGCRNIKTTTIRLRFVAYTGGHLVGHLYLLRLFFGREWTLVFGKVRPPW